MRNASASLALVFLMLLSIITTVMPVRADIGNWQVWTDKTVYTIGETVTVHVQPTPMIGVALWLIIYKPDGSNVRVPDDYLRPNQDTITIPAGPPVGQYRLELWGQVVYPEATPQLAADCYFEVHGSTPTSEDVKFRGTVVSRSPDGIDFEIRIEEILEDPSGTLHNLRNPYALVDVWDRTRVIGSIETGSKVEVYGELYNVDPNHAGIHVSKSYHYIKEMPPSPPPPPCDVMQMVPRFEEAMNAAIESSTFNIDEGGSVSGEILSDIAVFVATTGFEKGIEKGLKISLDKLPKKTQGEIGLAEQILGNKAADELSSSALSLTLQIAKLYANYRGEPSAVSIEDLTGLYDSHFDYFRSELTDIVKTGACPRFDMQYWSRVLDYYVSAVRSSKEKGSFYVSFWRIGTIGQSAEAKRWWNSPLKDLSDYSLLALQIAYIFALPEGQVIPTLMEAGAAVAKAAIYATILQQIVEENVLMYQDYFVLTRAMVEALRNPDLYSAPAGTVTTAIMSPVSLLRSGTGEVKYEYSWNVPMDIAASLALFDPNGKVLFWQMGATQSLSSHGQATWTLTYPYPGIAYALQHRKMRYKLFIHNLASTSFEDYLVGPIEGEVDVGILSTKSTLIQLQERAHKLFLHAYDPNGRHVGVDHATGEVQIQIPGAYYSDEGHLAFVALPADFVGFRVAVDATGAEEPVESFDLTISVLDESNVMLQRTKSSDIQKGENIEYLVSVVENAQEISITNMTATSSSTTTAITTSPQSVLDWIMNALRELIHWLECLFLRKCG